MHSKPLFIILWLWLLVIATPAQEPFTLTADSLQNGQSVELDKLGWKYSPNDDPQFSDPHFDDRAWETLNGTAISLDSIPQSGWRGLGWFRLRLQVDPALIHQPLALVLVHYGASEVYLDGKLIERFGTVGTTPETEVEYNPNTLPLGIVLDGRSEHVLAVRHSCIAMRDVTSWWSYWIDRLSNRQNLKTPTNHTNEFGVGFGIKTQELRQALAENERRNAQGRNGFNLYLSGLPLAIGLLHLLLYGFYLSQRTNLFFGLCACFISMTSLIEHLLRTDHYGASGILFMYVTISLLFTLGLVSGLAFVYSAFLLRLPKLFWLWLLVAGVVFLTGLLNLFQYPFLVFFVLTMIEIMRVVIQAMRNRVEGAWIIGLGLLLCMAVGFIVGVNNLAGATSPVILKGFINLSLVLPPSLFLARRSARTNRDLAAQLVQIKQLSDEKLAQERREAELHIQHEKEKAENERRARELEEARQLQLSMLPKKLPQLPHLDIAAYMKTASEVGGDYYDFHLGEDGTLTIAVGDATGHGLKAGTMVASVKSLFMTLAYHPDIPHIFHRLSTVLKEMKLRGLFMALTIAKVKDSRLTISLAGMPPVWIYRAVSKCIEEVALQQLPLGGVTKYVYRQNEYDLAAGDVVVLLSDGLSERFNPQGAMLEDEAAQAFVVEHAHLTAQDLINGLANLGDDWGGARPQDDDVTLVVLKVK